MLADMSVVIMRSSVIREVGRAVAEEGIFNSERIRAVLQGVEPRHVYFSIGDSKRRAEFSDGGAEFTRLVPLLRIQRSKVGANSGDCLPPRPVRCDRILPLLWGERL